MIRVGNVYKCQINGQFVIVMKIQAGLATFRYEEDRTNALYECLTKWLS